MNKICSESGCKQEAKRRGMCMRHYDRAIHARTIPVIQPRGLSIYERVNRRCKLNEDSGCIEWTGSKNEKGYGLIGISGVTKKVHRVRWEMSFGPIPEGKHVLHKCDNRACINLAHLFLGTHDDNMDDMNAKGRLVAHKGEKHGCAKLTEEQVRKIRSDTRLHREIAADYQIVKSLVGMIKRREVWKHIA